MEMVDSMFRDTEEYGHRPTPDIVESLLNTALLSGQSIFVAEIDGELAGLCAWVMSPALQYGEVLALGTYVEPGYRKTGVSAQMRKAATAYWTDAGAKVITGSVDLGNDAGMLSMQSNGFSTTAYLMEKKLGD